MCIGYMGHTHAEPMVTEYPAVHVVDSLLYSILHCTYMHVHTVEPPNKGDFGDNINSAVVSFVERLSSFGGSNACIRTIGKTAVGTLTCVLCREVYYTVSLSRRVHYRRVYCNIYLLCLDLPSTRTHAYMYL